MAVLQQLSLLVSERIKMHEQILPVRCMPTLAHISGFIPSFVPIRP